VIDAIVILKWVLIHGKIEEVEKKILELVFIVAQYVD
jgi:hypothetical protein